MDAPSSRAERIAAARHEAQTVLEMRATLRAFMARTAGTRAALIAPSTDRAFRGIAALQASDDLCVIGHAGLPDMEPPVNLVAALLQQSNSNRDAGPATHPAPTIQNRIVLFTDQLVSATEATVAVVHSGAQLHVSPLEFILCHEHGFDLYALNSTTLVHLPAGASFQAVTSLVLDHLEAANALGDAWLARDLQAQRSPASRRFGQRRYIRAMQSSILGMLGRTGTQWQPVFEDRLQTLEANYPKG